MRTLLPLCRETSQGTRCQYSSAPLTRCEQGATNHLSTYLPNGLLGASWFKLFSHHSEWKAVLHLEQEEHLMTINDKTQACCGVGQVRIHTDSGASAKVNVLVTWKDILGFNLLLRYDTIKALGGILITQAGTVQFLELPVWASTYCSDMTLSRHWAVSLSHKLELCNFWSSRYVPHFTLIGLT